MKANSFAYCKNYFDVVSKTTTKGKGVDVLYCIIDTEIYVFQGMKILPISLDQFADGLEVDLALAQVIINQKPEDLTAARAIISRGAEEFEQISESSIVEKAKHVKVQLDETTKEVNSLVKDVIVDTIDYAVKFKQASDEIKSLKSELLVLGLKINRYQDLYGELPEEIESEIEKEEEKVESSEGENSTE